MIRLRALGTLDLRLEDGRVLESVLSRPKRMALLAYLMLARPYGFRRRDSLLALFWPESPEKRARHSLNQALYVLRKALGAEAVITDGGGGVGVSPEVVSCDVRELDRALAEGRPADALDLYAGELLEGFHLTGSREFDRWLERERSALRERVVAAARDLATEREADGNPVGAIRALRKATAWSPYDVSLRSELLRLLAAAGDRAGALREYEAFAGRLREELELTPPDDMVALAASLRKEPSAGAAMDLSGDVPSEVSATGREDASEGDAAEAAADPAPATGPARPGRAAAGAGGGGARSTGGREWTLGALLAIAVLVGVATTAVVTGDRRSRSAMAGPAADFIRISVLPFEVRGDEEEIGYLRHGMAELLARKLDGVGPIRAVEGRRVRAVLDDRTGSSDLAEAPLAAVTPEDELPADYRLAGSVVEAGGRLQLQAALYGADGAPMVEVGRGSAEESSLFGMVDELARAVVAGLHDGPPDRLAGLAARTTSSLPALKRYLAGEAAFREARYGRAVDAFREAVVHDTAFALAWYRLAMAGDWAAIPYDSVATKRALRLAHRLPPRERRLLEAWQPYRTGSWKEAERLYARLVADYPDELEAWSQLAEVRYHGGWLRGQPVEEAREAFERVLELDPGNEGALLHLARIAALERRVDRLARLTESLNDLNPASPPAVEGRGLLAAVTGDPARVARSAEELRALHLRHGDRIVAPQWAVFYATEPETLRRLAPVLLEWDNPDVRAAGHLLAALERGAAGRWQEAEERLRGARSLHPVWSSQLRLLWSLVPFRRARYDRQSTLPPGRELPPDGRTRAEVASGAFLVGHIRLDLDDDLALYLEGLRKIGTGHVSDGLSVAATLGKEGGPLLPVLGAGLRARALHRTAGPAAALEALDAVPAFRPYEGAWISPFWARSLERWLRAELLEQLGRDAEALQAYGSFDDGPVWDLVYRAPAHFRRAWIHDRLGHPTAALDHYRRVLELWEDPDPELEPLVELARARVRTLHGMAE